jgi:hypothetical protein
MDKFEEIGQRLDKELARLRKYVEEEVAPGTAQFLVKSAKTGIVEN